MNGSILLRTLEKISIHRSIERLLGSMVDYLPDVYLFAKDRQRRFVYGNRAFAGLMGVTRADELVGRPDEDFFPPDLCESYRRDDDAVIASGEPLVDKVELVRNKDGSIDWFSTTKLPVRGARGRVIGVLGITRDLKKMNLASARFLSMAPVLEAIMNDYAEPLGVPELAAKVGLSVSQFERQFKKKFRTTPHRYITQIRIDAACRLLASTDLPIVDVAMQTGFYDQSHFTNQFVRSRGTTPSAYRKRAMAQGSTIVLRQ